MNRRTGIFLAIAAIGLSAFTCCEEDGDNLRFIESESEIIETELPTEGELLKTITFNVRHLGTTGCAVYARTEKIENNFDVFVTYYQKVPADAMCTDNIILLNTPYEFTPKAVGEYTFHFKKYESYLEQKIMISE
jgi:hypothetical protein